jgi:hypothetical protein
MQAEFCWGTYSELCPVADFGTSDVQLPGFYS